VTTDSFNSLRGRNIAAPCAEPLKALFTARAIVERARTHQAAVLAAGVRVMAAAVLGSEGFQRMRFADGVIDVRHAGRLVVGERTVVMASAVVARAVFRQANLIGADYRIGNGAFVSHNCRIGARTLVGHQATVTGNCVIGNDVTISPGVICLERVTVGDGAVVTAGAVVVRPVAPGQRVSGECRRRPGVGAARNLSGSPTSVDGALRCLMP
jgi:UDP-3-O-[3-hydroxymyristoyl] glucosamine N-acyltransferase